jgi:hypothetical protein
MGISESASFQRVKELLPFADFLARRRAPPASSCFCPAPRGPRDRLLQLAQVRRVNPEAALHGGGRHAEGLLLCRFGGDTARNLKKIALLRRLPHVYGCYLSLSAELAHALVLATPDPVFAE